MNSKLGIAALAVALSAMAWLPEARATIIFNVGSATVVSDGINPTAGTVDVFLTTDAADVAMLGGFQAHVAAGGFTGTISGVTFGIPGEATTHLDQFPLAPVTPISSPPNIAGGSFSAATPFIPLSGLMSVPFTVAAGELGTFTLSFVTGAPVPTELYNSSFATIPTGFVGGTISVVPEPSTIVLGAIGLIGFAGARWRRRRTVASA